MKSRLIYLLREYVLTILLSKLEVFKDAQARFRQQLFNSFKSQMILSGRYFQMIFKQPLNVLNYRSSISLHLIRVIKVYVVE